MRSDVVGFRALSGAHDGNNHIKQKAGHGPSKLEISAGIGREIEYSAGFGEDLTYKTPSFTTL